MKVKELIAKLQEQDPEMFVNCEVTKTINLDGQIRIARVHEATSRVKLQKLRDHVLYVVIEVE